MQEWGALLGIIATLFGIMWRIVVLFKRFIKRIADDYIEPWTNAIKENTNSLNVAKVEHKQLGKRLDTVESQIEDHGERIKTLERDVNHEQRFIH